MKKIQCISCQEIIEKHDEEITIKKRNECLFLLDRERLGEIEGPNDTPNTRRKSIFCYCKFGCKFITALQLIYSSAYFVTAYLRPKCDCKFATSLQRICNQIYFEITS